MIIKFDGIFVKASIIGRSYPNSNDYWDGNWLKAEIEANTYDFKGKFRTNLRTDDFQQFYQNLLKIQKNETNQIEFTTMEEGLHLIGKLDITGNINWNVAAKSEFGNKLLFNIETDNAYIVSIIKDVVKILNEYPVIGDIN